MKFKNFSNRMPNWRTVNINKSATYVVLFLFLQVVALSAQEKGDRLCVAPSKDSFQPVIDLLTIDGTTNDAGIYGDTIRLYDRDGSLWFEYSLLDSSPLFYQKNTARSLRLIFPAKLSFFRLKAISKYWYEVEVNSETHETKYMRINDPFLKRDGIKLRILLSPYIKFDESKNPLRETPDGAVIEYGKSGDRLFKAIGGMDGDWVQLEMLRSKSETGEFGPRGWIKWKENQELLIRFAYR